jgi:hypothetical protein
MRKILTLAFAVLVVGASFAITASSAVAVDEWLIKDNPIAAGKEEPAEITGELLLEDSGALVKADLKCSGIWEADLLPGGVTLVLKLLMLNKVQFAELDLLNEEFNARDCLLGLKGSCEEAEGTLLGAINLNIPWKMEILLFGATFVSSITEGSGGTEPGYEVSCDIVGVTQTDVCNSPKAAPPGADLTNIATGVEAVFSSNEERNPAGNCSMGGTKKSLMEGTMLITSSAGLVSVS